MHRTNTPEQVYESGYINIDAGEGVHAQVPGSSIQTGLRRITDLAPTRTAGDVYVQRDGNLVMLQFTGLVCSDQAHGFTAITLPVGFRSSLGIWDTSPLHVVEAEPSVTGQVMRSNIGTNGAIRFFAMSNTTGLYLSAVYLTNDPAPASLPGVAH